MKTLILTILAIGLFNITDLFSTTQYLGQSCKGDWQCGYGEKCYGENFPHPGICVPR